VSTVTLSQGQTWYEGPDDVHLASRNGERLGAGQVPVFMVKGKGAPILVPAK
jgi:hypothetical protein